MFKLRQAFYLHRIIRINIRIVLQAAVFLQNRRIDNPGFAVKRFRAGSGQIALLLAYLGVNCPRIENGGFIHICRSDDGKYALL